MALKNIIVKCAKCNENMEVSRHYEGAKVFHANCAEVAHWTAKELEKINRAKEWMLTQCPH